MNATFELGSIIAGFIAILLTVIGFLIVQVLQGIREELKETKEAVKGLETKLYGGLGDLDRRITRIESRCCEVHGSLT